MSERILLKDGWIFAELPYEEKAGAEKLPELLSHADFQPITLPHDWQIYHAEELYRTSIGWYGHTLNLTLEPDKTYSLRLEGVYMDCHIYINGMEAGEWKYGYSTFEIPLTGLLHSGENLIFVEVRYQSPNSRWYSGAGIYRNVWLITRPAAHIAPDGIYITTSEAEDGTYEAVIDTELEFSNSIPFAAGQYLLRHTAYSDDGSLLFQISGETAVMTATELRPDLWDIHSPKLYTLKTELFFLPQMDSPSAAPLETEWSHFGFRTTVFDPEQGFFLNGRKIKLNGACQHHDLGCLGSAVHPQAIKRQLLKLKEMGVNAIRTSHNMPAIELMDLADELGLLIVSEAFDMWERAKTPYDYARFFRDWAKKDVASWIRRDRNHPSIILWSIGNEIYDTHADGHGLEITRFLSGEVRKHDPRSHAPVTIGSNYMPWENARKCADYVKFAGYNYGERYYTKHHKEHPDWLIYGSETASTVQSRGIYHFPLSRSILSDDDRQCSSLGNSSTSWGADSTEQCILDDRNTPFSAGQFIWSGFDYIGEPTPYHTRNSYFGQIDTAGFPKDSFYIYQAAWTNYRERPMIHIFPYWDFNPGQQIDVLVCTNAPQFEFFFNGKSFGRQSFDPLHGDRILTSFQIPYETGTLSAIAYDEDNRIIARDSRHSFTDAVQIHCFGAPEQLCPGELAFIEISVTDRDGYPVENANNRIHLELKGGGYLLGMDNGDSTDRDPYKTNSRRLFQGKLLAVAAGRPEGGSVTITLTSPGLQPTSISFFALPEPSAVLSAPIKVTPSVVSAPVKALPSAPLLYGEVPPELLLNLPSEELPIRKLEIHCPEGNHLSKEKPCVPVMIKIYPEASSCRDIRFRLTDDAGIDSPLATFTPDASGLSGILSANYDGLVRLRVCTGNGDSEITLISQMEFYIQGFGNALLDPYQFISGGLYSKSNLPMTNGNDRGVATLREGESHVGYERVNFGSYGSDEITLPVFAMTDEPVPIEFWLGMPGEENSRCVAVFTYTMGSRWNTYLEQTFELPERICGIQTVCFVVRQKIHMKGFLFTKKEKAYERLGASAADHIYGDRYTVDGEAVRGIGNNVTLEFEDMDFGAGGTQKVRICGHTGLEKNTIQIRFTGMDGSSRAEIAEFLGTEGEAVQEFFFEKVEGRCKVDFIFLPGAEFDFEWVWFERGSGLV